MKTRHTVFFVLMVVSICAAAMFCTGKAKSHLAITESNFGTYKGKEVIVYKLESTMNGGISVLLTNYGASISSIQMPDRNGRKGEITLGFDSLEQYIKNPFFGSTVGRFANRIAHGLFSLDSIAYKLPLNNGSNHLHGGPEGFHSVVWEAQSFETPDSVGVVFKYTSADGEQGYPGKLEVTTVYSLNTKNELNISMEATTDAPTIVNLTNHAFFNLTAQPGATILDHELQIFANHYTPVDSTLIPTGEIVPVNGTPMDFTVSKTVGKDISLLSDGYDHNYVLTDSSSALKLGAILRDPLSGRAMKVFTNQPGIQFYSGNFFNNTLTGREGVAYPKYAGLCLEPQNFPDAPNHKNFPSATLRPGAKYFNQIKFHFFVNE